MNTIIRIAILTNMLAPYRIPLFNRINGHSCVNLHVFVRKRISNNRKAWMADGIQFKYTTGLSFKNLFHTLFKLAKFKPQIIVTGGYSCESFIANIYKIFFKTKLIIWSGESELSFNSRSFQFLRLAIRKIIIRRADGFIAYSPDAKEYLIHLGAKASQISIINNICNTDQFLTVKKLYNQSDSPVMIFVGELTIRKNPMLLIEAYERVLVKYPDLQLLIVGDGPLKNELQASVESKTLRNCHFVGQVSSKDIHNYFLQADFFVLPSFYDLWPHVVMESMAVGLPVLVSQNASIPDYIVQEDLNGYFFDPNNLDDLVYKIYKLLSKKNDWFSMGKFSRDIVKKYSLDDCADRFLKKIKMQMQ